MKKPTVQKLKKELDKVFSLYIRQRDNFICFTCGLRGNKRNIQNGHFVPRQYNATRYDERNCNAQCFADNMFYNGQPTEYALRLQEKYGDGIVKELNDLRKKIKQFTVQELQSMIELYKSKIKGTEALVGASEKSDIQI